MKILLTGGGTGGHFYPVVAIAESLRKYAELNKIEKMELYYMAPEPYNKQLLDASNVTFIQIPAGKLRRYISVANFFDVFKTGWGIVKAVWKMFMIYPDVVFGKGGYASFPALTAAWILRIPIVIHESDTVPGRLNARAGKFAKRVAVSYPSAAEFFPADKVAHTGNPIRKEIRTIVQDGAHAFFGLNSNIPVILILGGSQGSQIINENLMGALSKLVEKYQIIHQAGKINLQDMQDRSGVILYQNPNASRYKVYDHLNDEAMRMAAGAADLIVSRAGSTIFEIAVWGIPAILIPIADSNGDHQRKNAYAYARTGAAVIVEEDNLSPGILSSEVHRLLADTSLLEKMKSSAKGFAHVDASDLIAQEIVKLALPHEA